VTQHPYAPRQGEEPYEMVSSFKSLWRIHKALLGVGEWTFWWPIPYVALGAAGAAFLPALVLMSFAVPGLILRFAASAALAVATGWLAARNSRSERPVWLRVWELWRELHTPRPTPAVGQHAVLRPGRVRVFPAPTGPQWPDPLEDSAAEEGSNHAK
jgi:hypothetical protein